MSFKESFLKLGSTIISPAQIVSINLNFCDENNAGVLVSLSNGEFYLFERQEAEILRRYFMLGSFATDLNSLYGEVKNGGQQQW
ncbi:hypothetical protein [Microseira sp. BLCC-F43]|jgi:hypothetical protein|uniref:hypothetical protein n=1 Tax=Microseira sp. BLCC-F43 TaxID=3153602 RepID=UPI0035B71782